MKPAILTLFVFAFLTACATARLSQGPDVYSLLDHQDSLRLGLTRIDDGRDGKKAGTIGATTVNVKPEDLAPLISNYIVDRLNRRMNLNVMRIPNASEVDFAESASQHQLDGVITGTITALRIFSADAILQPVEVNLNLDLQVYDRRGKQLYRTTIRGHYKERIGITIVDKSTGRLVEATVRNAMDNLARDSGLKAVLSKMEGSGLLKQTEASASPAPTKPSDTTEQSIEERINTLKKLYDNGTIDKESYETQKTRILDGI